MRYKKAINKVNNLLKSDAYEIRQDTLYQDILNDLAKMIHDNNVKKGFYENDSKTFAENIALMHSELSEALEADRKDNPPSEKIDGHCQVAEELADAVIRILDTAAHNNIDIGDAIVAKHQYNLTRPYKHGKKY